jgi:hypothetical protein
MKDATYEEGCNCVNCRLARIEAKLTVDREVVEAAVLAAVKNIGSEPMSDKRMAAHITDELMEVL